MPHQLELILVHLLPPDVALALNLQLRHHAIAVEVGGRDDETAAVLHLVEDVFHPKQVRVRVALQLKATPEDEAQVTLHLAAREGAQVAQGVHLAEEVVFGVLLPTGADRPDAAPVTDTVDHQREKSNKGSLWKSTREV